MGKKSLKDLFNVELYSFPINQQLCIYLGKLTKEITLLKFDRKRSHTHHREILRRGFSLCPKAKNYKILKYKFTYILLMYLYGTLFA